MNKEPLLSICMATYKRESHIRRQYEYFVKEMEKIEEGLVEVIISNNASPDGTSDFLHSLEGRHPWLVINQNNENIGCAGNLKLLLHMAKGIYFFMPGDDDYLRRGLVNYLVELLQDSSCAYVNLKTRLICERTKAINAEGKLYPVPYGEFVNLTNKQIYKCLMHDHSNLKFQTSCVVLHKLALQSEKEGAKIFTEEAINSNHSTFRSVRAMQQGKSFFTKEVWVLGGDEATWSDQAINEQSYDSQFISDLNKAGIEESDCRRLHKRITANHVAGYLANKELRKQWKSTGYSGFGINLIPDLSYLVVRKLLRKFNLSKGFETIIVDPEVFGIEADSTVANLQGGE
ncbi:MAG: glycosyltransferase [Lachnospiraceae bacterium]|jgi:glycosyltransferase involved in cell wall biosynthesis|nr:glycosyltransferase [Lachnospiraceae bacterium]